MADIGSQIRQIAATNSPAKRKEASPNLDIGWNPIGDFVDMLWPDDAVEDVTLNAFSDIDFTDAADLFGDVAALGFDLLIAI